MHLFEGEQPVRRQDLRDLRSEGGGAAEHRLGHSVGHHVAPGENDDPGGQSGPAPDTYPDSDDADDESSGSGSTGDRPLEPPAGTTDDGGSSGAGDEEMAETGAGSESATAAPTSSDTSDPGGTDDGGTTSEGAQPNGVEDGANGTTGTDCIGLECLPPCEPDVCGQPCGEDVAEGTACAGEGGALVTCDMGVWNCAA